MRARGERVSYPDLPEPFDPQPNEWLAALQPALEALEGERIVLCHSLACLLWLLNAREGATDAADRVLLAAPPCTSEVEQVVRFQPDGVTPDDVERAAGSTLMLWSEPDPYCLATAPVAFDGLFTNMKRIPDAGHLNTDAGYGPWPEVEEWALGA
ncbi:MAG: serine hydrolase [Thermoleophilaceae bacterium]|nr:serine hydrolase [Thermoleophilaceae bacterium]